MKTNWFSIFYAPAASRSTLCRIAIFLFQIDHEFGYFLRTGVKFLARVGDSPGFAIPLAGEQHILAAIARIWAKSKVVRVAFFLKTYGKMLLFRSRNKDAGRAAREINLLGFAAFHHFDLTIADVRAALFIEIAVNRQILGKVKLDAFQVVVRPILAFVKFLVKNRKLRTAGTK